MHHAPCNYIIKFFAILSMCSVSQKRSEVIRVNQSLMWFLKSINFLSFLFMPIDWHCRYFEFPVLNSHFNSTVCFLNINYLLSVCSFDICSLSWVYCCFDIKFSIMPKMSCGLRSQLFSSQLRRIWSFWRQKNDQIT